ncbi:hypothetical protein ABZ771_35385 [Streptomyces globisporus]|uniref:hypothetical protein n=1 Tax=Streptomyces globisporus TaxID=1908 RepID=UPI00345F3FE3
MAKPGRSLYPFGRRTVWVKIRHEDTMDASVVGYTGPCRRPRNLALNLPGATRFRLSARRGSALAARVRAVLAASLAPSEPRVREGEFTSLDTGLVVEALAGAGRHGTLAVVRMR